MKIPENNAPAEKQLGNSEKASSVRARFGRRIRELRKERGYSQEGFAAASELDRSYYGAVERGERNVSLENIATIARTLDTPIRELFPADEPPAS